MRKMTIVLQDEEFELLVSLAKREYRNPRDQARHMLRSLLGKSETQHGESATSNKISEKVKVLTSIAVPISKNEFFALLEAADNECRHPRDQARYMLRVSMGLED